MEEVTPVEEGEAVEELQPPPLTCVGPADRSVPQVRDKCGIIEFSLQQNVQMCTKMTQQCETVMEKVCQQVPIRVSVH